MKKTVCIFLALFAILAVVKAQKTIRVAAFNYYPAIFMDTDGVVKGFYVDALNELGEKENLKFIYVFGSWNEGLERIKTGEVDMLTSVAITEERLKHFDYTTTPLLTVWSEVYVKSKSEIKGILDLNGKTVAVMKSDFNGIYIKQLTEKLTINCNFIETTDFEEVFKLIEDEDVDAGVVNNIFGAPKSIEYQLISSGIVFNPFEIYFAVKKDSNQDLLKLLNTTLHNWKHDRNSVLNTARQKWSHANVGAIEVFPKWLQKAVYTTLFIVLALFVLIAFLRYKIGEATKSIKKSEERFILAMKASNDGLFDWNLETNDIYYSPGWKKMLGYEDHELPNDFSIWENFTDPEDVKKTWEVIDKITSKQIDRFVTEFKMKHKDGHWVDILARAEAFFNTQGKALRIVGTHVDISVRKKAEIQLIESKYHLQAMINAVPDMIFRINTRGVFLSYKADADNLYVKSDAIIGKNYKEIMPQYFIDILDDKIEKAITSNDIQIFEYQLEIPEKGIKIYEARMSKSGENEVTSVVRDITERKKADETLKITRFSIDHASDGLFWMTSEAKIIDCNPAACISLGYTKEELLKLTIPDIDDDYQAEKWVNHFIDLRKHSKLIFETKHRHKDGHYISVEIVANYVKYGELELNCAFVRDISERKKVEEKLLASENKYRQLFDLSPVGTLIVGMDKRFIKCNTAFCNFIGYTENELIGKHISEITYPEDIEVGMNEIKQIANGSTEAASVEKRYLRKDGQIVWGNVAISIVKDATHKPLFLIPIIQDITKRKQSEIELMAAKEKVEESETYLRTVLQSIDDVIVSRDLNNNAVFFNKAFELVTSELFNQPAHIGLNTLKLLSNENREFWENTLNKVKNGEESSIEYDYTTPSNTTKYYLTSHMPIFKGSKIVGTLEVTKDISIFKQREAELKIAKEKAEESDERLRNLVDSTEAIIWEADAQTFKFTFVSNQAERLLGHPIEDWYADGFWANHLYEDDKEEAINYCVYSTKQKLDHDFEYRFIAKDGRIVWLRDVVNVVIKDQEPHVLRGVMFDITANKLAQEALKVSEQKLSALFASMTEMVALHELEFNEYGQPVNYRITDCNAAYTQVTGIKKEEAIGKLATELYGTETPPYFEEYKQVAISGKPHTYNTYFAPMDKHFSISVVSPKKNHFATITNDITAMQQIQNIISAKNKELENYLYVSSHDLRSPLVNIQGFSQRLQKQINSINLLVQECELEPLVKTNLTQITDKSIPETLNFIFTSVAKMDVLINSLLQISRVGRIKMEIKNIETNLLITNIINQLNFQLTEISATIKVEKLPHCFGDENTLNQLFANILDNAIKYRNPKVPLLIKIEGKVIYNKVIYSIRDNGVGIAPKYLNKIWDVFYRIDPSIHENGEGIGLSIVKRIVDKHKGKIWVESEEGLGTTFYIELLTKEFEE